MDPALRRPQCYHPVSLHAPRFLFPIDRLAAWIHGVYQLSILSNIRLIFFKFWAVLWDGHHGPVYSLEPEATLAALYAWRELIRNSGYSETPIFTAVKDTQWAFNGFGAQEATDLCLVASISPLMPAFYVCDNDNLWTEFVEAVIKYHQGRMYLAREGSDLPHVSGACPFFMNVRAHARYLASVGPYRRKVVCFDEAGLQRAHERGLFTPNTIIQPDGRAVGECVVHLCSAFSDMLQSLQGPSPLRLLSGQPFEPIDNSADWKFPISH